MKTVDSYLKKLYNLNFDYERQYAMERSKIEFPDYTIDLGMNGSTSKDNLI